MPRKKQVDIAYAAGLIDGEGCIRIKKRKAYKCEGRVNPGYQAFIQIRMVDEEAIAFICELLDGWYYHERRPQKNRRPLYCYQVGDAKAEKVLRILLPYLRVKKRQAEVVLALRDLQKEGKKHKTKIVGYRNFPNKYGTPRKVPNYAFTDEYVARCESLFLQCKELNRVGVREEVMEHGGKVDQPGYSRKRSRNPEKDAG